MLCEHHLTTLEEMRVPHYEGVSFTLHTFYTASSNLQRIEPFSSYYLAHNELSTVIYAVMMPCILCWLFKLLMNKSEYLQSTCLML